MASEIHVLAVGQCFDFFMDSVACKGKFKFSNVVYLVKCSSCLHPQEWLLIFIDLKAVKVCFESCIFLH